MQKLHYTVFINAPREKVWNTMLDDATYRQWTAAFHEGSYYKGDWSEGSKILFLGPNKDGTEGGMVSRIKKNRLHEFVSIEHIGFVMNGVEDTTSDEVKKWAPSYENYTFAEKDGGTEVEADLNVPDEFKAEFDSMWPKSLVALKALAEK